MRRLLEKMRRAWRSSDSKGAVVGATFVAALAVIALGVFAARNGTLQAIFSHEGETLVLGDDSELLPGAADDFSGESDAAPAPEIEILNAPSVEISDDSAAPATASADAAVVPESAPAEASESVPVAPENVSESVPDANDSAPATENPTEPATENSVVPAPEAAAAAQTVPAAQSVPAARAANRFKNDEAQRVLVIANSLDPGSLEVAKYYMRARKIPPENLIELPMSREETISWQEYSEQIQMPLAKLLTSRGLIDGTVVDSRVLVDGDVIEPRDEYGRQRIGFSSRMRTDNGIACEQISYVVLCRGVPLRIDEFGSESGKKNALAPGGKVTKSAVLEATCASVDSELAVLPMGAVPVKGPMKNPLFKEYLDDPQLSRCYVLRVARLDGPTVADAKSLVDSAIQGERDGLLGRAYIDIGGPYRLGDNWLEKCAVKTRALGFDTSVERSRALMDATTRYDAPALYFGWYSSAVGGFFRDPNFRFPAGAVALHIYSFSAATMRSKTAWTPGFVARGAAATVGNVYEPTLGLTHFPHLFLEALANGETAGAAAMYSMPALSWQGVFVGDPLYRPFTRSPDAQISAAREGRPTRLSQYAFLRAANLARNLGDKEKADMLLREAELFAPGLALNCCLFEKETQENGASARQIPLRRPEAENPGLLNETAKKLAEFGRAAEALEIYSFLLDRNLAPSFAREKILRDACDLARSRGDSARLTVWKTALDDCLKAADAKKKAAAKKKAEKEKAATAAVPAGTSAPNAAGTGKSK